MHPVGVPFHKAMKRRHFFSHAVCHTSTPAKFRCVSTLDAFTMIFCVKIRKNGHDAASVRTPIPLIFGMGAGGGDSHEHAKLG